MSSPGHTAILLMAYGSPNSLDEVGDYLVQVRGGRHPTQVEIDRLKLRYERVGGRTPLLDITQSQARGLEQDLHSKGLDLPVYLGMKHWHPFIEDVLPRIVQEGATSIIGIALTPHYSRLSIGGYEDAVRRGLGSSSITLTMVKSWHREERLIAALSNHVREGLKRLSDTGKATVLFTAHSLPKGAVTPDDPYQSQLLETSRLVAETVPLQSWAFAFQSAGEPSESWLGPQVREKLEKLNREGVGEILACPVGFVSDHLEILYDLDIEARNYAHSLGMRLERTDSLNSDPAFIEALSQVVMSHIPTETPLVE